jgi:endonuclease YncB( thermonuclease family)
VTDGDSLTAICNGKPIEIRIYAIDAPEMAQPGGIESKQNLQRLIKNSVVLIEEKSFDKFGRTSPTFFRIR